MSVNVSQVGMGSNWFHNMKVDNSGEKTTLLFHEDDVSKNRCNATDWN